MTATNGAIEAAAYWLMTFLGDGGTIIRRPAPDGLYWPLDPPMPNRDWLRAALAGEVNDIIRTIVKGGHGAGTVRAAVRDKVREIIASGGGGGPTLH